MTLPRELGRRWENHALKHLQAAGLKLLARNYHCRMGEVDLIMREGESVVFVEVRFRRHKDFGSGAESVGTGKQRRLIAAARFYLLSNPGFAESPCRFDVVSIGAAEPPRVEWIRHAFTLDDV